MSGELSLTVQKAIGLLTEVGRSKTPMRLVDLVESSGLSKTVCFRLLATLESEGMLRRDVAGGAYMPGLRLIELAGRSLAGNTLRSLAAPVMDEVARMTGDSVILFVPSKLAAMCIERRDGNAPVRPAGVDIGESLQFNTGGAPLALLSFMANEDRERFLSGALPQPTNRSMVNVVDLRKRIVQVRKAGYAVGDEDAIEYVVAVGAPIFGRNQSLLGALSVGGIKPRYTAQKIREIAVIVCEATTRISSMLGANVLPLR
jgi:DNA-binding IclR family transcriptional regulator